MKFPTRGTRILAVALWLIGVGALSGALLPVRFVSEHIIVTTHSSSFEVEGFYEYLNPAPWPTALLLHIPIPADEHQQPPAWLTTDKLDQREQRFRPLRPIVHRGESSVRLFFMPGQRRVLHLRFEQPITAPQARYLLVSTHEWHRPIETASFELHLNRGQVLESSSYALEPMPGGNDRQSYGFRVHDFWPPEDWIVQWTREEPT